MLDSYQTTQLLFWHLLNSIQSSTVIPCQLNPCAIWQPVKKIQQLTDLKQRLERQKHWGIQQDYDVSIIHFAIQQLDACNTNLFFFYWACLFCNSWNILEVYTAAARKFTSDFRYGRWILVQKGQGELDQKPGTWTRMITTDRWKHHLVADGHVWRCEEPSAPWAPLSLCQSGDRKSLRCY